MSLLTHTRKMTEEIKSKELDRMWMFFMPLFALLLGVDQLTKIWAMKSVSTENDGDFGFELSYNKGIAFGIDMPSHMVLALTIVILIMFAYLVYKHKIWRNKMHLTAAAILLAGAMGNTIDRLRLGQVVDFIKVYWWPTFNVADMLIVIGVALFTWEFLIKEEALGDL